MKVVVGTYVRRQCDMHASNTSDKVNTSTHKPSRRLGQRARETSGTRTHVVPDCSPQDCAPIVTTESPTQLNHTNKRDHVTTTGRYSCHMHQMKPRTCMCLSRLQMLAATHSDAPLKSGHTWLVAAAHQKDLATCQP